MSVGRDILRDMGVAARSGFGFLTRALRGSAEFAWGKRNHLEGVLLILSAIFAFFVVFTYAWWPGWWMSYHVNWKLTYGAGAIFCFLLILFRLADRGNDVRHSLEGVAAFFTSLALIAAGYWYFYERPGVPKVDLTTSVDAWPVGGGNALVRVVVEAKNVGTTVIDFDLYKEVAAAGQLDLRRKIDLGSFLPFDPDYQNHGDLVKGLNEAVINRELGRKGEFMLVQNYLWPALARQYEIPQGEIESGETDKYYYKALVPCSEGMILVVTARLPKLGALDENGKPYIWLSQALSEPIVGCH